MRFDRLTVYLTILGSLIAPRALAMPAPNVTLTSTQIALARKTLERSLRDYEATKLKGFRVVVTPGPYDADAPKPDTVAVCGDINSPNAFGGMTGWQSIGIILSGHRYAPTIVTDDSTDIRRYMEVCAYDAPSLPNGRYVPPGAVEGTEDVSSAIAPPAG